ncbi:hypothetical protein DPMN_137887 [Dreissena polymorpha]|uniref:Uncharacterized protein n=1 Tax=Dreissena polymorpha TaxID=45954 RepID=A0A9D4G2Q3_DREPO|nr:hypothetical protein DPMN_137887 [Dreissena polymorpha]
MGVQCSFEVVPLRLMVRTVQQHVGRSERFLASRTCRVYTEVYFLRHRVIGWFPSSGA